MVKRILVDSLYINNSGGKVLLDYLVSQLEQHNLEVFYIFDERCEASFNDVPVKRKMFMEPSLVSRYRFYKKHKLSFDIVLCFGNLPPNIKLAARVYTYFHQPMFLTIPTSFSPVDKLKFWLKIQFVLAIKYNTDFWIVQSGFIKQKLMSKYKQPAEKVLVVPFYPPTNCQKSKNVLRHTYLYVSGGSIHKNHVNLVHAFSKFFKKHCIGELILTVDNGFSELIQLIEQKKTEGINIRNLGFIAREDLIPEYQKAEYIIYPSLAESFGLGLIEGVENGCKVIAADLPYSYEVCEPSIVFDPLKIDEIVSALELTLQGEIKPSKQVIFNEIDTIIQILKN